MAASPIKVLVAGCGHMGTSHAKAYHALDGFEIMGVLDAIMNDRDLSDHMDDTVNSLRIVLAADEAFKIGRTVELAS